MIEADARGVLPEVRPPRASAHEVVRITEHQNPDRLDIEARLDSPGLVVVADTYAPGWHASLDGVPTSIHPADLMFRAVPVPAGLHHVELCYRPRGFMDGTVLFMAATVACALVLAVTPRIERRPPRGGARPGLEGPRPPA